ncbi:MAG: hypothetical protein FJX76_28045 [Armatimonadetes bacterium]|nr:hypothetical protein [Armatimonadota bacterium]
MSTETVLVDATTLIGLAAVGQFDLLRTRFGVVHIVEQVWNEVAESPPDLPGVAELKQAVADGWCRRIRLPQANVVSMALGPARGTEARRQAAYRDRHRVKHGSGFAIVQASGHSS